MTNKKGLNEGITRAVTMGATAVAAGAITGSLIGLGAIPGAVIAGTGYALGGDLKTDLAHKKELGEKGDKKMKLKKVSGSIKVKTIDPLPSKIITPVTEGVNPSHKDQALRALEAHLDYDPDIKNRFNKLLHDLNAAKKNPQAHSMTPHNIHNKFVDDLAKDYNYKYPAKFPTHHTSRFRSDVIKPLGAIVRAKVASVMTDYRPKNRPFNDSQSPDQKLANEIHYFTSYRADNRDNKTRHAAIVKNKDDWRPFAAKTIRDFYADPTNKKIKKPRNSLHVISHLTELLNKEHPSSD